MNQNILPLQLAPRDDSEDSLVVSRCNQLVFSTINQWPNWAHPVLLLVGAKASGKTHFAHVWQQKSGAVMFEENTHLHNHKHVLVDVDNWSGVMQEALFHAYQHVATTGGSMLVTLPKPVLEMQVNLPDLKSRLLACQTLTIEQPDDAMVPQLLFRHLAMRQLVIPANVMSYIVKRIERSYEAILQLVEQLDAYSMRFKKPITMGVAKEILAQI